MIKNSIPLHPLHTFFILFFFLSCPNFAINGSESLIIKTCISSEREALLMFKRDLVDDDGLLSSWGSEEEDKKDCCQWSGVRCSNRTGHVIALDLSSPFLSSIKAGYVTYEYERLGGKLSPSLLELHHLRYLNLSYNHFGSTEPIPKFIGSLVELKYLDLSWCRFHGIVPFQLGNLSKLRHLDIGYNSYFNNINLTWLSNLTSLIHLDMSYVNHSRAIHGINTITSLPALSYLALSYCSLSTVTSLPHFLINSSTSIATLLLDWNHLKGPIPDALGNMTSLTHLDLSVNQFEGVIPKSFGNLCNLQSLDMWSNNISGNLPDALGNMTSLTHLDLSDNQFEGVIPKSFKNLCNLQSLYMGYNNFSGNLPDALGNMTSLTHLDLSGNQFEGVIPKSFKNLCNLQYLEVRYNKFSGNLPDFLENLYGCAEGSLQSIDLSHNQLKGSLWPDIIRFSSLREVHLHDNKLDRFLSANKIRGPVPDFAGFSSLQYLYLSRNQLSGTLPESIGQLSMLEELDVSSNLLEGVVSEVHLLNLTKLKYLDLSHNHLAVELSSGWVPPFQLDTIDLKSCKLGPRFPRWIRTQTNFSYLDISDNKIEDTIPLWFWDQSPSRLTFFNASLNAITGVLPDLSSKFAYYPAIDLSVNSLEGLIPHFPSNLSSLNLSRNRFSGGLTFLCAIVDGILSFLDLSRNLLSGRIPDYCLKQQLKRLVILDLSHNKLSGEIPSSIGGLSMIETIDLENNSLSGELPLSLMNCTSLKFLNLGENKLFGNIPSWVGENLSNLYVLIMRSNHFYGSIPLHLCLLVHLQFLDLSVNALSGHIPPCFNNFTAMVEKGISSSQTGHAYQLVGDHDSNTSVEFDDSAVVQWKGIEREFGKGLKRLKSIDLSRNELTGEFPEAILDLVEMVALNLSRNKLHGVIPQGIGQLISLESFDLSRNRFSAEIPSSISALNFLSYLDLAYNNLSGRIPLGTQVQSFDASHYMGNDELCGPPLTTKCPGDEETQDPTTTIAGSEVEDEFYRWFYTGLAVGYAIAFWAVSGALLLYRPWRHAYFLLLRDIRDWLYVRVAVCIAKCRLICKATD